MIRFRNEIFEDYFIDSNGIIKDKNGEIQQLSLYKDGRLRFKRMLVHKIQMHTNYGYDKDKDIHHKDGNKTNNSLDNLIYLTRKEHMSIHKKGNKNFLGKTHTPESILKTSMSKWKAIYCFELDKEWTSITEMCKELHIFKSNVTKVLQGKRKQTGGYTFKLIEKRV